MNLDRRDAEHLIRQPEFLRFLGAAIHAAGILGQHVHANGRSDSDLGHFEGRRSLGFDLVHMAHQGQPEQIRLSDPQALITLTAAIRETIAQEKPNDRTRKPADRYDAALGTGDDA